MVKGCRLSIRLASSEVTRLQKARGNIRLESKYYQPEEDPKTGFAEVFNDSVHIENDFEWWYKLDAEQIKDDGNLYLGDVDIDYGQRWIVDGDRETDRTNPVDDTDAPKRGFIFANSFDNAVLTLNFMMWQGGEICLGVFNKGNSKVTPEVVFRVTIESKEERSSFEFKFNPQDPKGEESHFTQIVTYHPATLG